LEGLKGGSAAENAQVIRDVLSGKRQDAARSATLLNAAAAIYVGGGVNSLEQGVASAIASVDSGAAMAKLAALKVETTRSRP
jgi:anthranilate phosphoribosyltransferase